MQGIQNYQLTESSIQTSDGLKYHYRVYKPSSGKSNKVLVVHHGFGEHGGRYENLVATLSGSGYTQYTSQTPEVMENPMVQEDLLHNLNLFVKI
jgi:hypothetical protein